MKKIYKVTLILGLISIVIGFIFRYSYINILGIDRPLKLVSFLSFGLGLVGSISALIDGVNRDFRDHTLVFLVLNILLIFTYPILLGTETFLKSVENPYTDQAPDYGYSTANKLDSSFIIEGDLYKMPLTIKDFLDDGFDYNLRDGEKKAIIKKTGASQRLKPTWFTDGENNKVYKEYYLIEAFYESNNIDENTEIDKIKISMINNNRDFEVMGIHLEDSIIDVAKKHALTEDSENKSNPSKKYYISTSDSYLITLTAFNSKIQSIEIEK
ncbi:hypothetical protein [Anaerococcus sp. AGMB09787]|uniref:hypothetical protein n=1 Tax=Anaerococcus sp. AGMB09787 TaxID=2922869 RepID=UPI001FAFD649|nr:hypothetical protein [Anaerococcus sp. AGMB09787]